MQKNHIIPLQKSRGDSYIFLALPPEKEQCNQNISSQNYFIFI